MHARLPSEHVRFPASLIYLTRMLHGAAGAANTVIANATRLRQSFGRHGPVTRALASASRFFVRGMEVIETLAPPTSAEAAVRPKRYTELTPEIAKCRSITGVNLMLRGRRDLQRTAISRHDSSRVARTLPAHCSTSGIRVNAT